MSVFPNAKSKLLGEPENSIGIIDASAVAGLSGSLLMSVDAGSESSLIKDGLTSQENVGLTEVVIPATNATKPITVSQLKNSLAVFFNWGLRTDASPSTDREITIRIRLDNASGTLLSTFVTTNATINAGSYEDFTLISTAVDIPISTTQIVATWQYTGTVVETSGSEHLPDSQMKFDAIITNANDTHAGNISTPATATKQVITPDTHTTQETGVIS